MKQILGWGLVTALGAVSLLACTTSKAGGTPEAATGGSGSSSGQITYRPDGTPVPVEAYAGHRFTARAHEPHYLAPTPPPPALSTLPRFVDGAARCFPRQEPVYRTPYPPPYTYGQGSGGGGIGSAGLGTGPSRSAAAPKKSSAAPGTRFEGESSFTDKGRAPAAEPAAPAAAPAPRADEKRRESADRYVANAEHAPPVPPRDTARGRDWGAAIYLSNDDTMSLSSAQRVIWAIDHYAPVPRSHVRPHELLNYFSFQTGQVAPDHDFSVLANIGPHPDDPNLFTLGLSVRGRPLDRATRRNANLAYVVDRSGSMAAEGRMEYLKQGLLRSLNELKEGDIVHITLFDTNTCDLAQNFVVGRDSLPRLEQMIRQIQPLGSTNLHDGLAQGYAAVDRTYQPAYSNRVVLVTDAIANTGVTDENLISMVAKHYDDRKVRLSGVGVGSDFNDSLLDTLTERGKGAYVFLGSPAEVDAVFGARFVSLIETVANDVHFRLHLPPSLAMQTFYGEEASTQKERVQAIHYFANTSQMFLSDLVGRDGARLPGEDDIMLSIEYQDPESGRARVEEFVWNLGQIQGRAPNLDKAVLVSRFARELGNFADRPTPGGYYERLGGWTDTDAAYQCQNVRADLGRFAGPLSGDPEVQRVVGLWDKFCGRYVPPAPVVQPQPPRPVVPPREWPSATPPTPPGAPVRNNDYAPPDGWPSAAR